jgi:hypothetical protein
VIDLKTQYGKRYKVALCQETEGCYEVIGKRGYVRVYGADLELYLTSAILCGRIERSYPAFKPKNHYDDATAFVFANDPGLVASACKWIKAKNRRQMNPAKLAHLAKMRSMIPKAS